MSTEKQSVEAYIGELLARVESLEKTVVKQQQQINNLSKNEVTLLELENDVTSLKDRVSFLWKAQ